MKKSLSSIRNVLGPKNLNNKQNASSDFIVPVTRIAVMFP